MIMMITELISINGNFERHFPEKEWTVPKRVEVRGDNLFWSSVEDHRFADHNIRSSAGLLEGFIGLSDAKNYQDFARYAKLWGVLRICRHGRPFSWAHTKKDE